MKLLFLNPHVDAAHELVKHLAQQGHVVLNAMDASEAWQLLKIHGDSVDAAFIHREGIGKDPTPGLTLAKKIASSGEFPSLAIVVTTQTWDETQCGLHQASPDGHNAYLRWPFKSRALDDVLGQLFGGSDSAAAAPVTPSASPPPPPFAAPATGGIQLQEVSQLGEASAGTNSGALEISLDLPDGTGSSGLSLEAPPAPPPVSEAMPPMTALGGPSIEIPTQGGLEIPAQLLNSGLPPAPPVDLPPPPMAGTSLSVNLTAMEIPPSAEGSAPFEMPLTSAADDAEAAAEMPYLYGNAAAGGTSSSINPLDLVEPVGDAIIPGGAGQSPDTETLKKYLLLREQDVAVLSNQLRSSKEQIAAVELALRQEKARANELSHVVAEQERRLRDFDDRKQEEFAALRSENQSFKHEARTKSDKARILESQIREAQDEIERIKERVRTDIRKIRVRERELENKLEILKKDSEALIGARETKIVELKRKLDLLEFNMDLLQDQLQKERESAAAFKEKLAKAAQVVRVAGGLLDPPVGGEDEAQSA